MISILWNNFKKGTLQHGMVVQWMYIFIWRTLKPIFSAKINVLLRTIFHKSNLICYVLWPLVEKMGLTLDKMLNFIFYGENFHDKLFSSSCKFTSKLSSYWWLWNVMLLCQQLKSFVSQFDIIFNSIFAKCKYLQSWQHTVCAKLLELLPAEIF